MLILKVSIIVNGVIDNDVTDTFDVMCLECNRTVSNTPHSVINE